MEENSFDGNLTHFNNTTNNTILNFLGKVKAKQLCIIIINLWREEGGIPIAIQRFVCKQKN